MSFPFETNPCRHDPEVLRDLAYDAARVSIVRGEAVRGEALREEEDAASLSADLTEHELCSDCRAEVARVARVLQALLQLEPAKAPFALDGKVVAATQAGHRQDRAVRALESLAFAQAPDELELRLRADLASSASFGSAAHQPPHQAPPELDERVAHELRSLNGADGTNELARSRSLAFGALVAAAALLLLVQLRLRSDQEGSGMESIANVQSAPRLEDEDLEALKAELHLSFNVRRIASRDQLKPAARSLFDQLAGPELASGFDEDAAGTREDLPPGESKPTEEKGF